MATFHVSSTNSVGVQLYVLCCIQCMGLFNWHNDIFTSMTYYAHANEWMNERMNE